MKTREEIITSMCMTYRHDYGLTRHTTDFPFTAGMLDTERQALWNQMAQIFDNDILPCMTYREDDDWK
jgi:hypothetical protein